MMRRRWALPLLVAVLVVAAAAWWALRGNPQMAEPPVVAAESPGAGSDTGSAALTPERAADVASTSPPATLRRIAASGVPIHLTRAPRIETPSPPYGPAYRRLRAAAETAPPATQYQLGLLLYECRDAPADEAALSRQIDQLYQTRRNKGWDVDNPGEEERALRRDYADCVGVPVEAHGEYRDWMRRAADAGLIEAQLNLMFHLPRADYCQFIEDCTPAQAQFMAGLREEARVQVGKALRAGSMDALRTVGGWALNEEMGPPDEVEAYANFSAYDQIQQAAERERELGAMLAGIRSRLRPVDLARAEARARELLSNPHCCVLTR